jgi:hypothetical protein
MTVQIFTYGLLSCIALGKDIIIGSLNTCHTLPRGFASIFIASVSRKLFTRNVVAWFINSCSENKHQMA